MAEFKRTFTVGRMNKDFDERLVKPGEYRDASNIEITTSEGSNVGTAQNIKGNTEKTILSSTESDKAYGLSHNNGKGSVCVATVTDDKTNKIYSLISDGAWSRATADYPATNHLSILSDYILEYDVSNDSYKYVFNDIYEVSTTATGVKNEYKVTLNTNHTNQVRSGMYMEFTDSNGLGREIKVKHTFADDDGTLPESHSPTLVWLEEGLPENFADKHVIFRSDRVLNFYEGIQITGINILDDFLFWTDNSYEPKKINIKRSLIGTGGSNPIASDPSNTKTDNTSTSLIEDYDGANRDYHTRLYSEIDTFNDLECVTNKDKTLPIYVAEEHITVIKKAPTTPPTLEMSMSVLPDRKNNATGELNNISSSSTMVMTDDASELVKIGDTITVILNDDCDWREGDMVLCVREISGVGPANPDIITNATIKFKVSGSGPNGAVTSPNTLQSTFDLTVVSISLETPTSIEHYYFSLEKKEPLFEFKFPRFAYRYRYSDGEFSPFSPWSEVAFIPGPYSYKPSEGYNLGMTNQLRSLTIKDYLVDLDYRPDDIVAIDILYKEEQSPNVYTVKTVNRQDGKSEGLELVWPDLSIEAYANNRGAFEITSELIHAVVPSNQSIRAWDAVPRKALAQEIVANRLVYGNYVQNYDVKTGDEFIKPEFSIGFTSSDLSKDIDLKYIDLVNLSHKSFTGQSKSLGLVTSFSSDIQPRKSVKTLRTYQLGIVYCDTFGRETPVLTDKATGSIYIDKEFADKQNQLHVTMKTTPPDWSTHYKYYIKETSNEYYNLCLDRWYNAEDGNIWLSFPSSERNKVDIDTFLILKKPLGFSNAVTEKARYKILAIENEAPEFVKTNNLLLGDMPDKDPQSPNDTYYATVTAHDVDGYPADGGKDFSTRVDALESYYGFDEETSKVSLVNVASENKLFVKFVSEDGEQSSEEYRISSIIKNTDNNEHYYKIKIDGIFSDDIAFIGTSSSSVDHLLRFRKKEVEDRPEFDGRFFVKVNRDQVLENRVLFSDTEQEYTVRYTKQIRYSAHGQQMFNQYDDQDPTITGTNPDGHVMHGFAKPFDFGENFPSPNGNPIYFENFGLDKFGNNQPWINAQPAIYDYRQYVSSPYDSNQKQWIYNNSATLPDTYHQFTAPGESGIDAVGSGAKHIWGPTYTAITTGGVTIGPLGTGVIVGNAQADFDFEPKTPNADGPEDFAYSSSITYQDDPSISLFGDTLDTLKHARRSVQYYKDNAKGDSQSWAIDQDVAYKGCSGRGIHKTGQGSAPVNDHNGNKTPLYGWNRINDCVRVLAGPKAGDYNGYNKSGSNAVTRDGRTEANSALSNISTGDGNDIYNIAGHSVMHLSIFGILGGASQETVLGNASMEDEWAFAEDLITPGTRFRWAEDPDLTVYEIVSSTPPQTHIRNTPNLRTDSSLLVNAAGVQMFHQTAGELDLNASYNKRNRFTVQFKKVGSTPEDSGFGIDTDHQFNPLVNAVGLDGNAITHADGTKVIVTQSDLGSTTHDRRQPYNYAGLAPNFSNYLNLQILDKYKADEEDTIIQSSDACVFETEPKEDIGLDIYYEASPSYPIEITEKTNEMLIPIGSTFKLKATDFFIPTVTLGDTVYTITKWTKDNQFFVTPSPVGTVVAGKTLNIKTTYGGEIEVVLKSALTGLGFATIHGEPNGLYPQHQQLTHLPWFNCFSFGNGVESNRIRDDFNAPTIKNGVKASTTLAERYREERRKSGLIFSDIYNSKSGVNNLNQFIAGEQITKDLNPDYGSIQKIYQTDTNLLTLCEDRVLTVLASKDALYNADGDPQLIASNRVLGTPTPISGEYGISTNPESFASYGSTCYFTDVTRGAVMKIKGTSMTPISQVGMSDYFSDAFKNPELFKCLGSFDEKKMNYDLTIENRDGTSEHGVSSSTTITYSEKAGGWESFKTYHPEQSASINNNYYTWKNGSMWQHYTNEVYNSFYSSTYNSYITTVFNDQPSDVKSFNIINYEGSQARVEQFTTSTIDGIEYNDGEYYNLESKNGWYCESITTDQQEGEVLEFKNKEGKWYNAIHGTSTTLSNLDPSEFSVQGIGTPSLVQHDNTVGTFTLTIQQDPNNILSNTTMTSISTEMNSGVAIQDQSFTKTITITPDVGYDIFAAGTNNDLTINGFTGVTDDGTTTVLTGSGGIWSYVSNVSLTKSGDNVIATFNFGANVMPAENLTLNVQFI